MSTHYYSTVMKRKLIKNKHQYKLNVPIELVRKLGLDKESSVIVKEVNTPKGPGFVVLKDDEEKWVVNNV